MFDLPPGERELHRPMLLCFVDPVAREFDSLSLSLSLRVNPESRAGCEEDLKFEGRSPSFDPTVITLRSQIMRSLGC